MDNILLILIVTFLAILLQKNIVETFIEDREDGNTYISPSVKDKNVNILGKVNVNNDLKILGKLTNKHNQDFIPKGMIVMWAGDDNNIPIGWHLCDGSNGTPDLRGRFICSHDANNKDFSAGPKNTQFGGIIKLKPNHMPPHNHTAVINKTNTNHTHHGRTAYAGNHTHAMAKAAMDDNNGISWFAGGDNNRGVHWRHNDQQAAGNHAHNFTTGWANHNSEHTHSITINKEGKGEQFDARPSFYTLAFIMKL